MGTWTNGYARAPPIGRMDSIPTSSKSTNTSAVTQPGDRFFLQPQKISELENHTNLGVHKTCPSCDSEQKKSPTWSDNFICYLYQYCDATTIHGIRYIGERGRFIVEKVVWSIAVAVLCIFCVFLIAKTYQKWERSPVIVTFATTETGIWKIPFPAVTICPEVKSDPDVFNYTDVAIKKIRQEASATEERYFETFSLVCSDFLKELSEELALKTKFTTTEQVFADFLEASADADPQNSSSIYWLGEKYALYEVLSLSITREGICYSFNMLEYDDILKDPEENLMNRSSPNFKQKKWSLEEGYPNDDEEESFPRRTFLSGFNGGFVFEGLFVNHSHLDYCCTEGLQGFKVTLHHPSEMPDMDKHFRVPLDQAVIVAIKPRMISVSDELRSYKPEARKCYFSYERVLMYFKSYTQQNCLNECLWNYTLLQCKCLAFYMLGFNATSPICGPGSKPCLDNSKVNYLSKQGGGCNCLPLCTELQYDVEITHSSWEWYEIFAMISRLLGSDDDLGIDYKRSHFSKLTVFYKDLQFLASERHELYGYTDFFSNVGGLLGLFIGFSVTSLLEILYFFSLRIACNVRKFGSNFWSGNPELVAAEKKES